MPNSVPKVKSKTFKKFEQFSERTSDIVGSPYWFVFSVLMVVVWAMSGPFMDWNERWQLIINTTTTILTFLMMALLHSSQSKWEEKMEKLQEREQSNIKVIEKNTKRLTFEAGSKPSTLKDQEFVDSLH